MARAQPARDKPFRIPLAGPYNSRVSAANNSDSTSGYVGIGIVGLMIVGKASQSTTKDAQYQNCFVQTVSDPVTGTKRTYTVKRPGWGVNNTPEAGSVGNDVIVWTGNSPGTAVISSFGSANSNIYNGTTLLGAITGVTTGLTETFVTTTPTIAITSSDNTAWYQDTTVPTKITDGDFPGNAGKTLAGTFAHIDGFACIMDTMANLWASDLNSLVSWTATSFKQANAYPDIGIGCVRLKNFIVAFCQKHMEFYYNTGTTPFPLTIATSMTTKVGAISAAAITSISDTLFWAGSTPQGGLSIFSHDGSGVKRISTPEIDSLLILAGTTNITLSSLRYYGRSFVRIRAGTNTYVYCIEENFWWQETTTTPLATRTAATSIGGTMVNYAISSVATGGKVYLQNHSALTFVDDGATYTARIQMPLMDFGTMRYKFWQQIELVCDRQSSSSPVTIAYTDDDYQTFQTWGTVDMMDERPQATRLGRSRRRGWVFSNSANTPLRIEAAEGDMEIGTL